MNWKNVPHLFANGKFKVKSLNVTQSLTVGFLWSLGNSEYTINDCTLIARKIESLTDKEVEELVKHEAPLMMGMQYEPSDIVEDILELAENGDLTSGQFLLLLSFGIYPAPFPTDGSVIDIKEIENEEG